MSDIDARKRLVFCVPAVALCCFAGVEWLSLQRPLFMLINGSLGPVAGPFWQYATILGDGVVVATAALCFHRTAPRALLAALLAAVVVAGSIHLFKTLLPMPRPAAVLDASMLNVIGSTFRHGSFPSGHTATAFAFAGIVAILRVADATAIGIALLAAIAGLSRVAVGAHWPSDVFAGAALGWILGIACMLIASRSRCLLGPWVQGLIAIPFMLCGLALLAGYSTSYPGARPLELAIAVFALIHYLGGFLAIRRRACA